MSVIRRSAVATALNIAGLAVAFAAFTAILIQVRFERDFDRCYPTSDRIFRVDLTEPGTFGTILPRGLISEVIPSSPHIEAGTLLTPSFGQGGYYLSIDRDGEPVGFKETVTTCNADLPRMFGFTIEEGDINCLDDPEKAIIPRSLADKLFGKNVPAVGKVLRAEEPIWTKDAKALTIGAVYRDLPENTQLHNAIYTAIDADYYPDNFSMSNWVCYLLLDSPASAADVEENFNSHFDFSKLGRDVKIQLVPLTDIYYLNETQDGGTFRSGNREVTTLLLGIALLIIAIAAINFTNFSTALTPLRIRSINTQKVLGSPEARLRLSLLAESALTALVAWVVGLCAVWMVGRAEWLPFIEADLDLAANLPIVALSGVIAIVVGVIAGLYPAYYVTSFPPALVLKGSFGLSPAGRKLRTALIGIQFVISIALIIGAVFVRLQNGYMRGYSLGFDKEQVAMVELSASLYEKHRTTYADRLRAYPDIEDVAFASEKIAAKDGYNTATAEYHGKEIQYFGIYASYNLLRVLGIPVIEGRDFTPADELAGAGDIAYIFNRSAKESVGMREGDAFGKWVEGRLVGFTGDLKITSLRSGDSHVAFMVGNFNNRSYSPVSYIRLRAGADPVAAVAHIRKVVAELDPTYPCDVEFYDQVFDHLYHKEENLRSLVTLFSLLAIIISLAGLFGLVIFETQYRRKEIAIRKVLGASSGEIVWMFDRRYLAVVLACFVIAAPVAWYGVRSWLERFAYKTPLYWWVFPVALLLVAAVTLLTVTLQSWRAANADPAMSVKQE